MSNPPVPLGPAPISVGQFFALVSRFLCGYVVPFACALRLLLRPAWTFSALDVAFWCGITVFVVLTRLAARTEAEVRQWRTVALRHVAVAALVWLCCQSVEATV